MDNIIPISLEILCFYNQQLKKKILTIKIDTTVQEYWVPGLKSALNSNGLNYDCLQLGPKRSGIGSGLLDSKWKLMEHETQEKCSISTDVLPTDINIKYQYQISISNNNIKYQYQISISNINIKYQY